MTNLLFFFNKLEGWQNTDNNLIHEILIFLQGIPPHSIKLNKVTLDITSSQNILILSLKPTNIVNPHF